MPVEAPFQDLTAAKDEYLVYRPAKSVDTSCSAGTSSTVAGRRVTPAGTRVDSDVVGTAARTSEPVSS